MDEETGTSRRKLGLMEPFGQKRVSTGVRRYVVRRLWFAIGLVLLAASLAFLLVHLAPGDAVSVEGNQANPSVSERRRAELGLNEPFVVQYWGWLSRLARLDLGHSTLYGRPVAGLVGDRLKNTTILTVPALLIAAFLGVGLGTASASRGVDSLRRVVSGVSIVAISLPPLLVSLLFLVVASRTGWFPVGGLSSADQVAAGWAARMADLAWHATLPALALALPVAATIERLQAQSMTDTLRQPYVRAAVARGLSWTRVVWLHALPVAIRPVLGVFGVIFGSVLSGSFIVEYVASWPGLGLLTYNALLARDLDLTAGCALATACCLAVGTLASDLALLAADPRLRAD